MEGLKIPKVPLVKRFCKHSDIVYTKPSNHILALTYRSFIIDFQAREDEDEEKGESSAEIARAVKGIKLAFKEVDIYAIPHPGEKVAFGKENQSSNESISVSGKVAIISDIVKKSIFSTKTDEKANGSRG